LSVISQVTATPNRIIAAYEFAKTIRKPGIDQSDLEQLMSPPSLSRGDASSGGTSIARGAIGEALALGMLEKAGDGKISATEQIDDSDMPRLFESLLLRLSGVETRDQSDFPLALAWTLSQSPSTPISWSTDPRSRIESQCGPGVDFGIGLMSPWQQFAYWARFLGFVQFSPGAVILDPSIALERHLPDVFGTKKTLTVQEFRTNLADACPVFEAGSYRVEVESRFKTGMIPDNAAAFSGSSALGLTQLEHKGQLRLDNQSDAPAFTLPDWTGIGDGRPITHISLAQRIENAT